jgi:hypothetical protein
MVSILTILLALFENKLKSCSVATFIVIRVTMNIIDNVVIMGLQLK